MFTIASPLPTSGRVRKHNSTHQGFACHYPRYLRIVAGREDPLGSEPQRRLAIAPEQLTFEPPPKLCLLTTTHFLLSLSLSPLCHSGPWLLLTLRASAVSADREACWGSASRPVLPLAFNATPSWPRRSMASQAQQAQRPILLDSYLAQGSSR